MALVQINNDEVEELELREFMGHITSMSPEERRAKMQRLPEAEVHILSELALMYEAYEVCSTARDVLSGN